MKPRDPSITFEEYLRRIKPYWQEYLYSLDQLNTKARKSDCLLFDERLYNKFRGKCDLVIGLMKQANE